MKNRKEIHDNWETPQEILNLIEMEFGKFFDPCPLNSTFDGLDMGWWYVNYINPPYSRKLKEAFIEKAFEESQKGKLCIMLLPVSTSTKIFHKLIYPYAEIRFLKGRVKFIGVNTKGDLVSDKAGQHDSMIVIFRPNCKRKTKELGYLQTDITKKCLTCNDKKVAEMVEKCEGVMPEKKEEKEKHPERNPSYFWHTKGYNEALDLFPVLMAKKCLGCPKLDSDDISFRDKRLESKGDKT